jgi:predicted RecB family nuclease
MDMEVKISGIGPKYAELLRGAGIYRTTDLVKFETPDAVVAALTGANETAKVVRRLPTGDMVSQWIEEAMHFTPEDPGEVGPIILARLPGRPGTPPPRRKKKKRKRK